MKKKKLISILLLIALVASLSACGQKSGSTAISGPVEQSESSTHTTSEPSTSAPVTTYPATEPTVATPVVAVPDPQTIVARTENYKIIGGGETAGAQFNNGVAWAALYDESTRESFMGVINKRGELVYRFDKSKLSEPSNDLSDIVTTPFVNGLSAIYLYANWAIAQESRPGFIIVNSKGEEVYVCQEDNMYICGQLPDGRILVAKHESGFAGDGCFLNFIDNSLTLYDIGIECTVEAHYNSVSFSKYIELADGLYYDVNCRRFLNLNNNSWYEPLQDFSVFNLRQINIGSICNDVILLGRTKGTATSHYSEGGYIPINAILDVSNAEELWAVVDSDVFIKSEHNGVYKSWHGGSFLIDDSKNYLSGSSKPPIYTDFNGNTVLTFPTFPEGVKYKMVDDFSGGYAALYLLGVDGKGYVTLIDEAGVVQYDPVLCDNFGRYTDAKTINCESLNGYVFAYINKELQFINPDGEYMSVGDDLSGLGDCRFIADNGFSLAIGEGFAYVKTSNSTKYISLDGKTTIDGIEAKYNQAGQLLYTDETGALSFNADSAGKAVTSDPILSDKPAKDYVSLNNFSIEGKWKNVGSSTYGQLKSGAIVAFDGTHCNVVSPQDTYTNLPLKYDSPCGLICAILRCRPWRATARLRPPPRLTQIILAIPCLVSTED